MSQDIVYVSDLHLDNALRAVNHGQDDVVIPGASATPAERAHALQELLNRLIALTMEDGLTGLFNRRYFDRRLLQELQRSKRDGTPCSVCLIDADDFKRINDTHGHVAGDLVLKELSRRASQVLRVTDEVTSRLGGEEFAVILPGTDAAGALIAAERLRAQVERLRVPLHPAVALAITVSVGVATYDPAHPCSPEDLVRCADRALYAAKRAGKNAVRCSGERPLPLAEQGVTASEKDALLS